MKQNKIRMAGCSTSNKRATVYSEHRTTKLRIVFAHHSYCCENVMQIKNQLIFS